KNRVRWVAFSSTAPGVLNERGDAPLTSLYAMSLEPIAKRGTVLWRTTYSLGGDSSPTLLSDGRVLFSSWQRGAFTLMAISWAGENLNAFYGSHDKGTSQTAACELPNRNVVFVEHEGLSADGAGRLALVSLRRPLHSHKVLDEGRGLYRTPHRFSEGRMLVSYSGDSGSYGVYLFDLETGRHDVVLYDDPAWHDVDAFLLAPRPEASGRIPTVEFASVLDVGALKTVGQLQCMNVYESDRPEAVDIRAGQVKRVRLTQGVPVPLSDADSGARAGCGHAEALPDSVWPPPCVELRVLGEAPVEEDGSFYVNVSGDVPFYVETLDADGRALQTMRAWTWVRAGDQRGCIGCHENKELAPENRATQALIRARPLLLTGSGE
ncbi:hypothetical protein ACFL6M_05565, partial [Candidatus Eisenbacteria bacterium]